MAVINFPFGASATRRAPDTDELANGFGCGPADKELFDYLAWWKTGQIAAAIGAGGLTVDDTDLNRLARAIQSGKSNFVTAAGTANALTVTLTPTLLAYVAGMPLRILTGAGANTGAMTLNVDGLGVKDILRIDGGALVKDDVPANSVLYVIYGGASWRVMRTVPSEIASQKALFNLQTRTTTTRQSITGDAGNAYTVNAWLPASYMKKSATSNIVLWLTANTLTPGASGPSAAFLNFNGTLLETVASNAQPATSAGASVLNRVLTGLGVGTYTLAWGYKRYDTTTWSVVFCPTNADVAYLPAASTATLIIGEVEP